MSDVPVVELAFAGLMGAALGLFFFGGLWFTVRALPSSRSPALLMLGSFVIRISGTLAGFHFIMGDRWERLLACLVGFLVARTILVVSCGPKKNERVPSESAESWK